MLIDSEDPLLCRQLRFQCTQPIFSQVAEPRVVVASLGVVEMRNESHIEAVRRQQIHAAVPFGRFTHFVDLIDRYRMYTYGQRSCTRHDEHAIALEALGKQRMKPQGAPLSERIGGRAGAREQPRGLPRKGHALCDADRVGVFATQRGNLGGEVHAATEVVERSFGDVVGIFLKAVGRIEDRGRTLASGGLERPMRSRHRWGGLARTHHCKQPTHQKNPLSIASTTIPATRSGYCACKS